MISESHDSVSEVGTQDILDDEIDELVLQHRLRVEVGDQERDVVSLSRRHQTKQHRHQP